MSTLNSTTDRTLPRLQPRFQPDEAIGAIAARSVGLPDVIRLDVAREVAFDGVSGAILERHGAQRAGLRPLTGEGPASEPRGLIIDVNHACVCYDVDPLAQSIRSINGEPIFRPRLYLFNIVIAFEWEPSPQSIQQVRLAARQASDFLYDVTDGYMAIGQVLIGGAECLEGADIQILASNRIHPRSWIAALYQEQKYQPIRLGRGLWRKNLSATLSWDQPDGYRTLVHEWGHYALGLIDEYLSETLVGRQQRSQRRWKEAAEAGAGAEMIAIVAPAIALPVNSIMATLDASELVPRRIRRRRNTRDYVRRKTGTKYTLVDESTALAGPARLQLDLPEFPQVPALRISLADRQLTPEELDALVARATGSYDGAPEERRGLLLGNCWVYLLKGAAGTDRLIAQGTIGERDWSDGFRVLGAAEGDLILVISQVADDGAPGGSRLSVVCGPAAADLSDPARWSDRTPSPEQQPAFVDVFPAPQYEAAGRAPSQVRVLVEGTEAAPEGAVYVAGKPGAALHFAPTPVAYPGVTEASGWISEPVPIAQLDGHVLLRWAGEPERLLVSSFSHGGGPGTQGGGRVPITAGSAEGNAMLFFNDNREPVDSELNEAERVAQVALASARPALKGDEGVRIITTMIQGGQQRLAHGEEARSYIFSLACNRPLPLEDRATLVLYYDDGTRKSGGDLLIHRWSGRGWERLTTFAPDRQPYVAVPLHQGEAAPEVTGGVSVRVGPRAKQQTSEAPDDSLYVERYRVYWTPASQEAVAREM
jgi:hypothetical protein